MAVSANVHNFDSALTSAVVNKMAHDVVLDLVIEAEARRSHDMGLAQAGAQDDALKEFTDVIKQDITAKTFVQKTYTFDQLTLKLYLPKFPSQAPLLEGIYLHGTSTLTTRDASGNVVSKATSTYNKTWGLGYPQVDAEGNAVGGNQLIQVDYTGLALAA
jgi:hypothetical protein